MPIKDFKETTEVLTRIKLVLEVEKASNQAVLDNLKRFSSDDSHMIEFFKGKLDAFTSVIAYLEHRIKNGE